MEQQSKDSLATFASKDTWSAEDHKQLLEQLFKATDAPRKFKAMLGEMEAANPNPTGAAALKIGIGRFMLCRFTEAEQMLSGATDNKDRRYFQGLCWKNLRRYDRAAEEFARAAQHGWDPVEIDMQLIELQALSGELAAAAKALSKFQSKLGETAEYLYLRGLIYELAGNTEQAVEAYNKARSIDPTHAGATFRLAYCYDLYGEEQRAVELYTECISRPPVYASALLNLAVLYEDDGKYDRAIACLKRILATNPNHARARLFLRDARSSKTMYYDEDRAKRLARQSAILETPVTDFELSVRARNCLKKMNITTLGDLVRTTESQLLGYKNFGETSLKEIKDMLVSKNLQLGQALEDNGDFATPVFSPAASVNNEGVLATPIDQVQLSVRARNALESIKVGTLGELAAKTDAELLACKNFGQTSLNEIRQRLAEYGLQLREVS